ncbi:MAG TPA: DUF6677 family protein [Thermoanaerobaculia bacterium]|nr:DUF6677 family protein [Thermoanaerobaculia bacterium]
MVEPASVPVAAEPVARPVGNPVVAAVAAWLIPGLGHLYLRRWLRGAAFFVLVIASLWIGCELQGKLFRPVPNEPLSKLGTLGALGTGVPYFFLRYGQHYEGDVVGAGFEYGTAFLITAGLMNWLLILDVWDISRGKKE